MNDKKPTLEQISLYFDGLLPQEEKSMVEAYLQQKGGSQCMDLFQEFDNAMQPDLTDAQIDAALSNNVQEVHARLQERHPRRASTWAYLFSPQFILASIAFILLFMGVTTSIDWQAMGNKPADNPTIAENTGTETSPLDSDKSISEKIREEKEKAQGKALIAMAGYMKNAVTSGFQYATEKTDTDQVLKNTNKTLVGSAIKTLQKKETNNTAETETDEPASNTLIDIGKKQLAIGLGASMLHLVTVF
ncbi:hypothetical protein GF373_13600 [bacterium]|nr:hypothetical protein [bacterium]